MSVVLNFNYIVIRKSALEDSYPGGLDAFRADWIQESIGKDKDEDPTCSALSQWVDICSP